VSDGARQDERDAAFMRRALELALNGWGRTAPNPMVGAVVVSGDQVVGEGWHREYGGAHAEVEALREAGDMARGSTVYVSLEPCSHHGKTPPCADALLAAKPRRVVVAAADPGAQSGGGARKLAGAGIEVVTGVEEQDAIEINAPFLRSSRGGLPWLTLKLALSTDGALTDATRSSAWLTCGESRREVHRMRAGSGAILVGVGTVLCDDPLLTVRHDIAPRVPPVRVVLDNGFRTPAGSRLARSAREIPTLLISTAPGRAIGVGEARRKLESLGAETAVFDSMQDALTALAERGIQSILAEGGAGVAASLLGAGLVDRLVIFEAPIILGAGALMAFGGVPGQSVLEAPRMRVVGRREFGTDLKTVFAINDP
jgi:diaminohydroxyphosphoribosylaminopyrimidine deaminase / 5-amino-6-(5-phosphoribosylamino)uracil reductase